LRRQRRRLLPRLWSTSTGPARSRAGGATYGWTCEEASQEIQPGGCTAFVVGPGPSCFKAEMHSELVNNDISVSLDLASVELNAEPGHTFLVRLKQERSLLTSRIVLRLVKPDAAGLEIRRCRRLIPLAPDEMAQKYLQRTKNKSARAGTDLSPLVRKISPAGTRLSPLL
jgi:hypothetical protein